MQELGSLGREKGRAKGLRAEGVDLKLAKASKAVRG
jgi:hypothetical protein